MLLDHEADQFEASSVWTAMALVRLSNKFLRAS